MCLLVFTNHYYHSCSILTFFISNRSKSCASVQWSYLPEHYIFFLSSTKVVLIEMPFSSVTQSAGHRQPLVHYRNVSKSFVAFSKKHVCSNWAMSWALFSYSLQVMLSCQMLVQAAELQFCSLSAGSTLVVLAQYVGKRDPILSVPKPRRIPLNPVVHHQKAQDS